LQLLKGSTVEVGVAKGHAGDTVSVPVTETEQGAAMALDITDLLFDAPDDVEKESTSAVWELLMKNMYPEESACCLHQVIAAKGAYST
jgi:hypothetical protein